jgi:CubicO group peptidase (beta-lactamase class C family)
MEQWLAQACEYIQSWLALQMRISEQPGCIVAIMRRDGMTLETAYGYANAQRQEVLTPRHRFRIASHTKTFTAAGIMKLREAGRLRLDDPVGLHLRELHPEVSQVTIGQLLSHSAGLRRDGADAGYFQDRRPMPEIAEILSDLSAPPLIEPSMRFKYSNYGYGLLGLVIEALSGEPYAVWIKREIIAAAGLQETEPDMPIPDSIPFARGHSGKLLGRRVVIPGDQSLAGLRPAGGFVSTAADVARFFAQLSPNAENSVLTVASRREMTRRQWRNPNASLERWYGLGTMSGNFEGWEWFGHGGGLQGYISQTCTVPEQNLTVCVLTNAIDGWAGFWLEGIVHILRTFQRRDPAAERLQDWTGRWWSLGGIFDLVPLGQRVLVGWPRMGKPFQDVPEIEVTGQDVGKIVVADGYGSYGETARLVRGNDGVVTEVWLGGTQLLPEAAVAAETAARYGDV